MAIKLIDGGVTAAKGFEAAACAAKIKYPDRNDMAIVYSDTPAKTAGTYTTNVMKAAPVIWDRNITDKDQTVHAIIVNSGIANACTGTEGMVYCEETAEEAAKLLSIKKEEVLVCSTGVIGMPMPMDRVKAGVAMLAKAKKPGFAGGEEAAHAILTTDTREKVVAVEFSVGGKTAHIGGMCKGSGMIHPNMCTMLAFITTDVAIDGMLLKEALREDVQDTFNMISVDGDTSTNDTVLVLANGEAENPEITEKNDDYKAFCEALHVVNETLATKIAGDGEGATALFTVEVVGAKTKDDAKKIARGVVSSNLVKAAVAGHDANWGRVFDAMGNAGVEFDPLKPDLSFISRAGCVTVAKGGMAAPYSEEDATKILAQEEVKALIDLHEGDAKATAWGCDLTHGYISINADYRS